MRLKTTKTPALSASIPVKPNARPKTTAAYTKAFQKKKSRPILGFAASTATSMPTAATISVWWLQKQRPNRNSAAYR